MMPQPEIESNGQTDAVSAGLLELAAAALKQANCSSVPAQHSYVAPKVEPTEHALDHCLPAMWKTATASHANGSDLPSSNPATAMQQQQPLPHALPVRRKPRKPRTSAFTNNSTVAAAPAPVPTTAAQDYTAAEPLQLQLQLLQQPHLQDGDCLREAAYNDAADTQMADAGTSFPDDDDLYQPPGAAAAKKQTGRGSRCRKGGSKAAGGAAAAARRSIKASSNSGDVSDATDSGLLYCAAAEGDAAAAASKSKQDRLKEKNRLAQRRFRARQKTMLEQMQVRMDELAKQVEQSSKELGMLHKENLLLRNIVQEQQKALLSAVVQQQLLPDGAGEQQVHQDTTADAAVAAAAAQQQQQLQRLQELYAAQIKLDEDQQAAAATAAVAAATAALHSAGEAMAAVTGGRL